MVVHERYKQTEIGVIPMDWEVKTIVDIISKRNGIKIGPFGSQLKKELLVKSGYKVYGQENVFDKDFEIGNRYLTEEHFEKLKSCNLIFGDFIISMMGTIGKCMIVPENIEKGIMDSHLLRLRLNEKIIKPDLLLHFFSSILLINQVNKLSVGGIMDGLSSSIVKKIQIGLPTNLAEQTAIATALSDADGLITGLEKLIAKKRNIKQGAMQQLLQPKEGWEVKKLGEVCDFQNGTALEKYFNKKDGYKVISIGNYSEKGIFNETNNFIAKYNNPFVKKFILNKGELAFLMNDKTAVGTIIGRVLYIEENNKYVFNQRTMRLSSNIEFIDSKFLFHLINSDHYHSLFVKLAKPGTQIYLNTNDVLDFEIIIPNFEEQTRIATILSDMDAELKALEQKLEKYKKVKLGMMQELLTGKTRLV
jgi:type I restriction enzyme S subunit